ncbi:thiamine-phosphate kinase [Aeromicrobium sp.]|uniref:thiamine-phosphate kinase n=1 Tax=Aeromicrobium sp. TaxID=1871063 RepID=UPI003C50887B
MATSAANEPTIGDVGEFGLIDQVRAQIGDNRYILLGSGDDAAHISTNDGSYIVSTDLLIEGRHFRRDWSSAHDIGRKAAACNLSDINAMGGVATAMTLGFGAPADLPVSWVLEMVRGFEEECANVGAHIVGGDVTASDKIVLAVTAMGDVARPVLRSGALPGDVVAYAGILGLAGAGYATLSRGFRSPKAAVETHRVPHPPYAAGPQAAAAGATAMTDVSDGLLADLGHLADASGVSIDLESVTFEIPGPVATVSEALGADALGFVLTGGDDYALVATFSSQGELPSGWTRIGTVSDGRGVTVDGQPYDGPAGHQHFR